MKNICMTIYTKEQGKIYLTKKEQNNFNFNTVTCHRTDGPAIIWYNQNGSVWRESYYINNKLHRTDGPAIIYYYENGSIDNEYYYINNKLHKIDGPTIIWYYKDGSVGREEYYINNKRHRTDGPAVIFYNKNGIALSEDYYITDKYYDKEDYDNLINEMKALPKSLRLTHELWWVREL